MSGCLVQNSTYFLGSPKPAFDSCVGDVWGGVRANARPQGYFQKKAGEAAEATGQGGSWFAAVVRPPLGPREGAGGGSTANPLPPSPGERSKKHTSDL